MVDFCIEPEKRCHKDPIRELDLKVDQYYSSIYSRLCKHVNDTIVHITQEERDEWNNKASKEALKDIQDQLNEITGDKSGSMKYEILLEVSKQITAAIDGLNLGDYAKKKYVDDAIKNIKLDGYVTKDYADDTYLKIVDYKKFDADSYYTKAEIQNMLKNYDIGKDYSIESFVTENNKLILTQKNGGQFAVNLSGIGSGVGVDADYVQDQLSNYIKKGTLARLKINDKVYSIENGSDSYIEIPTNGTGSNIDPTKFGYYKSYFKETTSNSTTPNKPSANKPPQDGSGWLDTTPDYKAGYYIWMTQVFINGNGQYGEYMNPICITGASGKDGSGSAGEDGSGISFIYKRSIDGEGVTNPGAVTVINGVPEVPVGWNDHPSGVTKEVPYEYCSCVTSDKGKWGTMWCEPFIWSHFGQNGMDGDGVEYIYYVALIAPTNNLPESWTNDEGFQNNEYIKYGSGWTDNPQNLDSEEFGPGYKQWVSVRKKYSDNDGQDPYWHAYSSPALWSYYSKDGIASALIMDVTGENKYLYLTQQNQNKSFRSSSIAHMYNDGASIDFTLSIDSFIDSAGNDHSLDKDRYFTINGNQIDINIPEGSLSFDNDVYYRIILIGKPKLTSISSQIRQAEIQLFGLVRGADGSKGDPGENAVSYDIKTSASAINYQDGSMYPNFISVYVAKSDGSQITNIKPSNSSGWQFSYSINDGDTWNTISSDQIQTEGDNGMLFKATNGTITLSEYVPIVKSGIDGLNGVTYSLQLSNISLSYAPVDQNYSLQMSFNVNLYKNGSNVNNTEANLYMQLNSNSRTSLQYDSDHWNAAINTTVQSKSSTITIYAYNSNGAYLTSMTIPVSSSGQKGDKGDTGDASNEPVIFDDQKIVAGMTSSKAVDDSSPLNGKVTTEGKGDVRIWAGEFSNGDLTTAPFTVTDAGKLKATNADISGKISATSGNIGGFTLNDNDLVCNNAKFTIDGSNSTDSRKVVLDTKGYKQGSYNFPLFVESYGQAIPLVDDFAGIYINVGDSNDTISPATYPGILMKRGCFVGFRVPTKSILKDTDLNNNNNYMSGMYLFCQNEGRNITITLPTKTTGAEQGDVFTIVKSGGGAVTIKAPTGYVLNSRQYGTRDFVMTNDYQHIHLVLDGNIWYIESSN